MLIYMQLDMACYGNERCRYNDLPQMRTRTGISEMAMYVYAFSCIFWCAGSRWLQMILGTTGFDMIFESAQCQCKVVGASLQHLFLFDRYFNACCDVNLFMIIVVVFFP